MKVLIINGSPRKDGNTETLIKEMEKIFSEEGIEFTQVDVGSKPIRGCIACRLCAKEGKCVFNDDPVNKAAKLFEEADGMVIASPVYYASPNGNLLSFLDRLFFSCHCNKAMKVGASFAIARRGGTETTFDVLNKYFTISQMPIASGAYWNNGFGSQKGEITQDEEGMQNARTVARNMVFLMRGIALAKEKYGLPNNGQKIFTNFMN